MRLLQYGERGFEKPGILDDDGNIRDLSREITSISCEVLSDKGLEAIRSLDPESLPLVDNLQRIGACVGKVGKFICVGLNYSDHAEETGLSLPSEPVLFMKATSAISGPNDPIELPRNSVRTDWEVELGVVIGNPGKYIQEESALNHVAGYCVVNDLSERDFQISRGGQWVKGKSCDSFGPIGPWLVTKELIPDPQRLTMWLDVNGHRYQDGSTANMVFDVPYLVSYISQFMSLQPGDIISTGTPSGVGLGQHPPSYLKSGDIVELGIAGLGTQRQQVV